MMADQGGNTVPAGQSTNHGVLATLKRRVQERDDHKCMKCGRTKTLEVHHIMPLVFGGKDVISNLITLCQGCHKLAPNDPVDFWKFAAQHLPPDMERARNLSKMVLSLMVHKHGLVPEPDLQETLRRFEDEVDKFFADMWQVVGSDSVDVLSHFFRTHMPKREERE